MDVKCIIEKSIVRNFDDGDTIFLDYEKLTNEEINSIVLSKFDVINIPKQSFDKTIPNYFCSFISSSKSKTGYIGMFINKDKEIYRNLKHINRNNF